jgi:hypothetical protein
MLSVKTVLTKVVPRVFRAAISNPKVRYALLHLEDHQSMGVSRREAAAKRTGTYLQRPID